MIKGPEQIFMPRNYVLALALRILRKGRMRRGQTISLLGMIQFLVVEEVRLRDY